MGAIFYEDEETVEEGQNEIIVPEEEKKSTSYVSRKYEGIRKKVEPVEKYDASTVPFLATTPADENGIMSQISYKNSAGNVEYMFNRNEDEGRKEINLRENVRQASGEGYYFVESDPNRYQQFLDKEDLSQAHSTLNNKLRRRTSFQSAIVGPLQMRPPSLLSNIKAGFTSKKDMDFSLAWRRPTIGQDPVSFVLRGIAQTASILDIAGNVFSGNLANLAEADAKRMDYWDGLELKVGDTVLKTKNTQDIDYAPYHVPTEEEVSDWMFKPEGAASEQFVTMLASGGGQSALITKMFNTFGRGKKIYYQQAKKTMRQIEKEGMPTSFTREAISGKDVAFGKAGQAVIDKKTGKIIRDVGLGKILTQKELVKKGIENPLGYNAAQRGIKGLGKPLTAKELSKMSYEDVRKYGIVKSKREAFKKNFNERLRRDYAAGLEKTAVNQHVITRFGRKLINKGSLEAVTNSKKFLAQAGLAEIGLNGSMVLASQLASRNPDDSYALFGPMNLVIGIGTAVASANIASFGGLVLNSIADATFVKSAFRQITGKDAQLPIDALDVLLKQDQGADEAVESILSKYPKAKRKKVLQMVTDITEAPMELRQDLITSGKYSAEVLQDLRNTVFTSENDRELLEMTFGELTNNKFLMVLEDHMISTRREGGTVSLNIIGADAVIKMKRMKALERLEQFLSKIDSLGTGTALKPETKNLIRQVQGVASNMKEQLAPRRLTELKNSLETAIESKLLSDGLNVTLPRNQQDQEAYDSLIGIYAKFADNLTDEAERLAAIKKVALYSDIQGAVKTQTKLNELIEISGKGVEKPNMGKVNDSFAKSYHKQGADIRKEGSDRYDDARANVQGMNLEGLEAEEFISGLRYALRRNKTDNILGVGLGQVTSAVNNSVRNNFKNSVKAFLKDNLPPEEFKASIGDINRAIHDNPITFMDNLIRNKNNGKNFLGITNNIWKEFEVEVDILSQYDVQRAVNQAIGNSPSRTIQESKLFSFKAKHDNNIKKFEESSVEGTEEAVQEYRATVENWRDNVVPATTNNRLWQKIESGRLVDASETFDKTFTDKILKQEFYDNPASFVQEVTRMYGKYDPELGKHVLIPNSNEVTYLNKTIKTVVDDIIGEEGERLSRNVRLKPIKPKDFQELDIPEGDIPISDLGFGEILFGDLIDRNVIKKITNIKNALEETGLTIGDSLERMRNYDNIVSENLEAQQAWKAFDKEMVDATKKLAGDTAVLKQDIDSLSKIASQIDDKGFAPDNSFLDKFVFGNPRNLEKLYELAIDGGMNPKDFNKIITTFTVTGLRRMAEGGPLKESIGPVTSVGKLNLKKPKGLEGQMRDLGKFTDKKLTRVLGSEENTATLGLKVSRDVDGLALKAALTENEDAIKTALSYGINDLSKVDEHMKHMRIVAEGLSLLQRAGAGSVGPDVLKASQTTIGGMTSRLYAVYSGRVSWRYVGIEALYMHMARNEAAAITEILADPVASRAMAYMIAYGKPAFTSLKTSDVATAWLPYVALKASEKYSTWIEGLQDDFDKKMTKEEQKVFLGDRQRLLRMKRL
tara:strand:+ start:3184 stop:7842 length:4659 start_codon:yes stop_codon:yes gene_type:complete